jgi:hypothetical protein
LGLVATHDARNIRAHHSTDDSVSARQRLKYARSRGPKLIWEVPAELAALTLARRRRTHGMDVRVFNCGSDTAGIFTKVEEALTILHDVDPRRAARLERDVSRIFVTDAPSASYLPLSNSCWLSRTRVVKHGPVIAALSIVHEATHARLFRVGVDHGLSMRERIERRCVAEQVSFLERLKAEGYRGTDAYAAHLQDQLSRPWWTDHAQFQRRQDFYKQQSAPAWLLRFHALVFRPKDR